MIRDQHPASSSGRWAALLLAFFLFPGLSLAGAEAGAGSFTGENPLGVQRAEFAATQVGMDLIYQRRYAEALEHFEEMYIDFPDSPVGPIGRGLVYQAQMFENYDFSRERSYRTEFAEAQTRLARALKKSPHPEWIAFLHAVHLGVDAMYDVRRRRFLSAFDKAWDALEEIKNIQRKTPAFADADLGLGLYNYWRTVITERVSVLPAFGDKRAEGLAQMRNARENGFLAKAPASFALSYSLIERGDLKGAIKEGERTQVEYPGSVLNAMTLAQAHRKAKDYPQALSILEGIRQKHPQNTRVWFQIAEVHYKSRKKNSEAEAAYLEYLKADPPTDYRAYTYYRLGQLEQRARDYSAAIQWYEKALKAQPKLKQAKKRLEDAREAMERHETRPKQGVRRRPNAERAG
ncbi:MAG: tetratricopeptide repeat protein [Myxococcota bacterium]|nr:tetratricopeptide repeat protein [Myxococcota bacterium]